MPLIASAAVIYIENQDEAGEKGHICGPTMVIDLIALSNNFVLGSHLSP